MYNIRNGVIRWQMPDCLLMAIVMIAVSLTVCKIFTKQEKYQKFDFKNKGHGQGVEERNLCYSTWHVCIHVGEFFSEFLATWEHTFMQKVTQTAKDRVRVGIKSDFFI